MCASVCESASVWQLRNPGHVPNVGQDSSKHNSHSSTHQGPSINVLIDDDDDDDNDGG